MSRAKNLIEIISEHVELELKTRYLGLCPFHDEKTPSFTVDHARQRFYCFGCNAQGGLPEWFLLMKEKDK